jgi:hypothetical protein
MNKWLRLGIVLSLATACLAQEGLTIDSKVKQEWPASEAEKIYFSACSAVQREFGSNRAVRPQVTVVLGADKDAVSFDGGSHAGRPEIDTGNAGGELG